jgi:23S rRNA (uracil1939-C5)-methyltransferase
VKNTNRPEFCVAECPACRFAGYDYASTLLKKTEWLHRVLSSYTRYIMPIQAAPEMQRLEYRQKAVLRCMHNGESWEPGMMKRLDFIPLPSCPAHSESVNLILKLSLKILPPAEIFPLAYVAVSGKQLVYVVKSRPPVDVSFFRDQLAVLMQETGLEGIWLHAHAAAGNKVFGKAYWELLAGEAYSRDENGMWYGPRSFTQQIRSLYMKSLDDAAEFLSASDDSFVSDLYCGTGYSLRKWLASGASSIGVESSPETVSCARKNPGNAEILQGTCADRTPQIREAMMAARAAGKRILLYANPPRSGLERKITEEILLSLVPDKIAYLSCSPGSLCRDLDRLCQTKFRIHSIIPYDFFPYTHHIECLALLTAC